MAQQTRFLALGFVLGMMACAVPAAAQNVRTYDMRGTNPDGSAYSGTFRVQKVGTASYNVRWQIGSTAIDGVGMMSGNIATATYLLNRKVGLIIFTQNDDGTMDGQWTVQGSEGVGTEHLTPR